MAPNERKANGFELRCVAYSKTCFFNGKELPLLLKYTIPNDPLSRESLEIEIARNLGVFNRHLGWSHGEEKKRKVKEYAGSHIADFYKENSSELLKILSDDRLIEEIKSLKPKEIGEHYVKFLEAVEKDIEMYVRYLPKK